VRVLHNPLGHYAEKTREPQVGNHDHHSKQKNDRVVIDRRISLLEIEDAKGDHEARADNAGSRTIYSETWQSADGQHQVNREKDEDGRQAIRAGLGPRQQLRMGS
jgi:hypothetical protein